jgi:hypothetical protein
MKFIPFTFFLAGPLLLGISCGGDQKDPSPRAELDAYFADVQMINDEYQGRLNEVDQDKQRCLPGLDGTDQDRSRMRAIKARIIECLTNDDVFYSSAREDWLRQMRAVNPPEPAQAAHQVLIRTGDNETALPSPLESVDGGIDPGIIDFLEACEDLVRLAADNGIQLRMWCSISSHS